MALIKWNKQNTPGISGMLEDFFRDEDFPVFGLAGNSNRFVPAVNVAETKEDFRVEVAAPGLNKNDFKISVDNNLLTISSQKEESKEEKDERYTRKEFSYSTFQRTFTLPESVNAEKISAKYEEGILHVVLPKREEAKQQGPKEIRVS